MSVRARGALVGLALVAALAARASAQGGAPGVEHAIVGDRGDAPEISTAELGDILARSGAALIDTRPYAEYAISHIPGAISIGARPGLARSMYSSDVAEITHLVGGRRDSAIVLYCNGPYCEKSDRLADDLLAAGYTKVRRYQLGIPVWRALGGVTQIEDDGLRRVYALDQTAVWIDARDSLRFAARTLPRARNIQRSRVTGVKDAGEIRRAKDDGRLPMDDHNTRIIVFADDGRDAWYVALQLTREAFHNVAFYNGTVVQALLAIGR